MTVRPPISNGVICYLLQRLGGGTAGADALKKLRTRRRIRILFGSSPAGIDFLYERSGFLIYACLKPTPHYDLITIGIAEFSGHPSRVHVCKGATSDVRKHATTQPLDASQSSST